MDKQYLYSSAYVMAHTENFGSHLVLSYLFNKGAFFS